jgi:hypothetical protein
MAMDLKYMIESSFGASITDDTAKRYATTMMKWMEYSKKHITDLIRNPEEAMELLPSFPITHTPENHHAYITPMTAYAKHVMKDQLLENKWKDIKKMNWEPIQDRYDENRPSEHQREQIMPFEDILRIREELEKGSVERLLLSFYSLMEPNRADYFATELVKAGHESKEENYITDGKYLVLKDFKTKAIYKKIENTLSEELQEELKVSLEKRPRNYLFVREDGTPYPNRKQFSSWACRTLSRALKHPMTVITMRHLYIKHQIHNKTPQELKDIARKMGHTRALQRAYEWI